MTGSCNISRKSNKRNASLHLDLDIASPPQYSSHCHQDQEDKKWNQEINSNRATTMVFVAVDYFGWFLVTASRSYYGPGELSETTATILGARIGVMLPISKHTVCKMLGARYYYLNKSSIYKFTLIDIHNNRCILNPSAIFSEDSPPTFRHSGIGVQRCINQSSQNSSCRLVTHEPFEWIPLSYQLVVLMFVDNFLRAIGTCWV